jgi:putative surface-exposed virulence protein
MAVSNGYAGAAENITAPVQPVPSKIVCPQDIKTLSAEQKKQLPAECLKAEDSNLAWLVAGGFAAAVALGIGVTEHNDNSGHHSDNGGDDGGDVTKTFANGVTLDESAHTLTFASMTLNGQNYSDVVFTYTQQGENEVITLPDGKSATVTGWETDSNNNLLLKGTYGPDNLFWGFNSKGQVVLASANTNVIDGDGKSNQVDGGSTASGSGETGTIINGNDTSNTISGDTTAADGGTGTVISGDDTTNTISGDTTAADGGTGTVISGDDTTNTISGNTDASGGGSGTVISGDGTTNTISGDTNASGGGTGTVISGDDTANTISGDTSASDGGTGTQINGDNAVVDNQGNTTADGEGSTGTEINGDNANVTQSGDILATNGATGLSVSGNSATLTNKGTVTAKDAGSVGISISGDNASFTNTGTITASNDATGVSISGNHGSTTLDGDVSLAIEQDAAGTVHGETGVAVSGDQNRVDITGDVTISSPTPLGRVSAESDADITGVSVTGTGNTITLDGSLMLDEKRTVDDDSGVVTVTGLDVEGDNNTVYLKDGVNIDATNDSVTVWQYNDNSKTGIRVSGDSEVIVSGNSSLAISSIDAGQASAVPGTAVFAKMSDGGSLLLDDTSVLNIDMDAGSAYFYAIYPEIAVIQTSGAGSVAENDGQINTSTSVTVLSAADGAGIINRGEIQSIATLTDSSLDNALLYATGSGSQATNSGMLISVSRGIDPGWGEYSEGQNSPLGAGWDRHYLLLGMDGATVDNTAEGTISATGLGSYGVAVSNSGTTGTNEGTINLNSYVPDLDDSGNVTGMTYNANYNRNTWENGAGMLATDSATATNTGTINVTDSGFGMLAYGGTVVNQGTINLGTDEYSTGQGGLTAMGAMEGGVAINDESGVININADYGQAFYADGSSSVVNKGAINLNGAPMADDDPHMGTDPTAQTVSGYTVGTNADGSAGTLSANTMNLTGVQVDTGFTAGTAAQTQTFNNVFTSTGGTITGEENITSTSVVWTAQGSQDQDGNVDVTMSKNAYADVTTDGNVSSVAQALDAGYTNNALYNSLNVSSTAELNNALEQISGSQATSIAREARVLSNRFDMLADAAPVVNGSSLAFNVVAKGDPRAELGNKAQYDMLALRQTLNLSAGQTLGLEYGIARLDGSGSQTAGDNGVTGGYSQFFGLKHTLALSDDGLAWSNGLRYDIHNLSGSRSVSYGDVGEVADADNNEQYLEYRTEGSKTWTLDSGLTVKPYAGMKLRHTTDGGYQEHGGGDFNLKMSSSTETAVDSIVGLKLDYAGKNGWSANAMLEGGPNVSYAKSTRTASLQGAAGQDFNVDDGQQGGGVNSSAVVGVKYSAGDTQFAANAYQWKEDTVSDKGFMLNLKRSF